LYGPPATPDLQTQHPVKWYFYSLSAYQVLLHYETLVYCDSLLSSAYTMCQPPKRPCGCHVTVLHMHLQVSRPAQERKRSPLGSPQAAAQVSQHTQPRQTANATDQSVPTCSNTTTTTMSVAEPSAVKAVASASMQTPQASVSSSTAVNVPAERATHAAVPDLPSASTQALMSQGDKLSKQGAGPAGQAMSAAQAAAEHDSDDPGRGGRDNDGQPGISADSLGMNRSQGPEALPDGSLPLMPADVRPTKMKTNRFDEPAALSEVHAAHVVVAAFGDLLQYQTTCLKMCC